MPVVTAVRTPPSGYLVPPGCTRPPNPRHPETKTSVAAVPAASEARPKSAVLTAKQGAVSMTSEVGPVSAGATWI
jgi:hypothetical protein